MRQKLYNVINKIYGILMTVSFFAGILPLIPFVVAIIVGGDFGNKIAVFLYREYYKWVILGASASVLIGLIGQYISGEKALSGKSDSKKKES